MRDPSAYFNLGRPHGLRWYEASMPAVLAAGRGDASLGAALIAATSARCGILDNLRRALRRESPLGAHRANIARALSGLPLSGPKVEPFRRALLGDPDAIPLDVWMLRAYNFGEVRWDDPSLHTRRRIMTRIRIAAARKGCTPRDYAASIWCGIILAHGREPLHYGEALRRLQSQEELWLP